MGSRGFSPSRCSLSGLTWPSPCPYGSRCDSEIGMVRLPLSAALVGNGQRKQLYGARDRRLSQALDTELAPVPVPMKLPQLSLRELFWLVLVCGLVLGWWLDHRRLTASENLWQRRAMELKRFVELVPDLPREYLL